MLDAGEPLPFGSDHLHSLDARAPVRASTRWGRRSCASAFGGTAAELYGL